MTEQEETLLKSALECIHDGYGAETEMSRDQAIQIVVDAIAGRSLMGALATPAPAQEPIPFKEPDSRPRKIIL